MKKILILLAVLLGVFSMQGQAFGFKVGPNFASLGGNDSGSLNVLTNFHVGALYEVDVLKFMSVQPELIYSVQGAKTKDNDEVKLNYINLPVMIKVYVTDELNLQAGPQAGILLGESEGFKNYQSKTFDYGISGGLEFFLSNSFFAQARYYSGARSISGNADLKNRVVQVSVGFMF
ncbi:porin family protein [Flavobacterium rhizosphaerae]|uniref:Porin family protein n=1 Tax=Flavobacterium rhizosphaerae TaxID=3163298 RepID=A0ABW8YXR9_9FLAO